MFEWKQVGAADICLVDGIPSFFTRENEDSLWEAWEIDNKNNSYTLLYKNGINDPYFISEDDAKGFVEEKVILQGR